MNVQVASGRLILLGHTVPMLRHRVGFTSSLRQYGDIVKIYLGPVPAYFLTSPELVHHVLVTEGSSFSKGSIVDRFRPFIGNGLALSNGAFHQRQRRLMQPAFHRARLTSYVDTMVRATTELTEDWRAGQVRQVDGDMQRLALTIVGETLFATDLDGRVVAEVRRSIPVIIRLGMIRWLSPTILEKIPVIPANRRFDEAIERLRRVVLEVIASWRADGTDHGDLLSMLMLVRDSVTGESMTDQEVFDEVVVLLTAGSETTSVALAWLFFELGRNPAIERRVRSEVDHVLSGRPVAFADVPKLEYTGRVINEVLRMYPLWINMRRALVDVDLGGVRLPAGAQVMFSPYSLHFDPRFHEDPGRFDPDRWLPEPAGRLPKGSFIPFGAGTRQCIGRAFAHAEIITVAATILARWRLVPAGDKPVRIKVTSGAYPSHMPMRATPVR